jgi:hypothetical protein
VCGADHLDINKIRFVAREDPSGNTYYLSTGTGNSQDSGFAPDADTWYIMTWHFDFLNGLGGGGGGDEEVRIRVNREEKANSASVDKAMPGVYDDFHVFYAHDGTYLKGDIAELIVYTDTISDNQVICIENYLANKYNLANT